MDVCSFGLWILLKFSATSSFEPWQPKPTAFLIMACDSMVCDAYCPEAPALTLCWYPGFGIHFIYPIVRKVISLCWEWWLFVYFVGIAGFSLGSDRGFLLSLVCCWSGPWVVSLLNLTRIGDDKFAEDLQPQSSFALFWAYDETLFITSLPEACARFLIFCWICWFCSVVHLYSIGGSLFCLGSFFFTCWVWRSVFQLLCSSGSFPGSRLGLLLNWACCRKDVDTLCLLFVMWLCVTSSHEFRQHLAFVDQAQDEMVFGISLSEANSWFYYIHWICSLVSSVRNEAALLFFKDSVLFRSLL